MREQKLTRRTFLGLGATAAVAGAAGLAGCAPAAKSDAGADAGAAEGGAAGSGGAATGGNPTEFVPSFMNPPAPVDESKVTETVDVDVCVVGLGLAGVCALREAAESGAKTFGFDKGSDVGYRSGEFGTFGSEIHKQLGIEQPETQEVVNELMKVMGNRPNAQLLNYWIANSGPDLDWYIGTAEHELLTSDHDVPTDPEKPYVFPERFPVNENYNWREENYPCFPGMVHLLPDHGWAMHGTLEAAQKAGAEARFNLKGEQLIKDGDRVVIIEDVTTSGKSIEETFPIIQAQGNVEIKGLMVSLNRMERGKGDKSALEEIQETYGFPANAIVTMEDVITYLYNRPCQGKIQIDDKMKAAIDAYYEEYGVK